MKNYFEKSFRFSELLAIAIGGTISTTYFMEGGFFLKNLGPLAFISFIIGGFITHTVMLCLRELTASNFPCQTNFIGFSHKYLSPAISCGIGFSYWVGWVFTIPVECFSAGILFNSLFPQIPTSFFTIAILIHICLVHVQKVGFFSKVAEIFTYTHMIIFLIFIISAILILTGKWDNNFVDINLSEFLSEKGLAPHGLTVFITYGLILLLNFQGTEIVGIAEPETKNPKVETIKTMGFITPLITILYVIPMILLPWIFPWQNVPEEGSIFAFALSSHNIKWASGLFTFLIASGALASCNSGLYAASRCIHAMSHEKVFPVYFNEFTKNKIPGRGSWITFLAVGIIIFVFLSAPSRAFYEILLSISGFSGLFAWLGICVCQYRFRKLSIKNSEIEVKNKIQLFPYLTLLAIFLILGYMAFTIYEPGYRLSFYVGTLSFIIPFFCYHLRHPYSKLWGRLKRFGSKL